MKKNYPEGTTKVQIMFMGSALLIGVPVLNLLALFFMLRTLPTYNKLIDAANNNPAKYKQYPTYYKGFLRGSIIAVMVFLVVYYAAFILLTLFIFS